MPLVNHRSAGSAREGWRVCSPAFCTAPAPELSFVCRNPLHRLQNLSFIYDNGDWLVYAVVRKHTYISLTHSVRRLHDACQWLPSRLDTIRIALVPDECLELAHSINRKVSEGLCRMGIEGHS